MAHTYVYFIAHGGPDTERARQLRDLLHQDLAVFLDVCNLKPGNEWAVELPRHQRQALATVALLSSATDASYYLREEIGNAIAAQRQSPATHRLIPVYLDGLPSDAWAIPYGIRGLHALDARQLGLAGVAAELRHLAAELTGGTPDAPPVAASPPLDRVALFDALCRLLAAQFDEITFRVDAPTAHLAPPGQPLARRALDLVQWTEQGGAARLGTVSAAIRRVAPGMLP